MIVINTYAAGDDRNGFLNKLIRYCDGLHLQMKANFEKTTGDFKV